MDITITRAGADDWAAYADIRLRSLRESPEAYGSTYEREVDFPTSLWQQRILGAQTLLAYAAGSEAPVGTATGLPQPDGDTLVVAMYVDPAARRHGCAHRLLDRFAGLARHSGGARLVLHVTGANSAADRCYTAYGFTRTGRQFPMDRDPDLVEIELAYPL